MTAPSEKRLEAATEAIRVAAKEWESAEDRMSKAVSGLGELNFSRIEFGIFQIPWQTYSEVVDFLEDTLKAGGAEFASMAAVLRQVAGDYDASDDEFGKSLGKLDVN